MKQKVNCIYFGLYLLSQHRHKSQTLLLKSCFRHWTALHQSYSQVKVLTVTYLPWAYVLGQTSAFKSQ